MNEDLEQAFDDAMRGIYRAACSECRYTPTRFLQLVQKQGGVRAAKILLQPQQQHSEGLTKLWEFGRLDLSMEKLVLDCRWKPLFTDEELCTARKRLHELHYNPDTSCMEKP